MFQNNTLLFGVLKAFGQLRISYLLSTLIEAFITSTKTRFHLVQFHMDK